MASDMNLLTAYVKGHVNFYYLIVIYIESYKSIRGHAELTSIPLSLLELPRLSSQK